MISQISPHLTRASISVGVGDHPAYQEIQVCPINRKPIILNSQSIWDPHYSMTSWELSKNLKSKEQARNKKPSRSNFRRCGFPVTSNHKKVHFLSIHGHFSHFFGTTS